MRVAKSFYGWFLDPNITWLKVLIILMSDQDSEENLKCESVNQ